MTDQPAYTEYRADPSGLRQRPGGRLRSGNFEYPTYPFEPPPELREQRTGRHHGRHRRRRARRPDRGGRSRRARHSLRAARRQQHREPRQPLDRAGQAHDGDRDAARHQRAHDPEGNFVVEGQHAHPGQAALLVRPVAGRPGEVPGVPVPAAVLRRGNSGRARQGFSTRRYPLVEPRRSTSRTATRPRCSTSRRRKATISSKRTG